MLFFYNLCSLETAIFSNQIYIPALTWGEEGGGKNLLIFLIHSVLSHGSKEITEHCHRFSHFFVPGNLGWKKLTRKWTQTQVNKPHGHILLISLYFLRLLEVVNYNKEKQTLKMLNAPGITSQTSPLSPSHIPKVILPRTRLHTPPICWWLLNAHTLLWNPDLCI